jgi:hypothetical protein
MAISGIIDALNRKAQAGNLKLREIEGKKAKTQFKVGGVYSAAWYHMLKENGGNGPCHLVSGCRRFGAAAE